MEDWLIEVVSLFHSKLLNVYFSPGLLSGKYFIRVYNFTTRGPYFLQSSPLKTNENNQTINSLDTLMTLLLSTAVLFGFSNDAYLLINMEYFSFLSKQKRLSKLI